MFSFNVDTRENIEMGVGRKVYSIAPFTGIDCGVKAVFQDHDDYYAWTLNSDNTVTKVDEGHYNCLTTLLPSTSNPKNVKDAVFKYYDDLIKNGNYLDTRKLIGFDNEYSVIRVYRDVFLAFDTKTNSWVLVRLVVP